MDRFEQYLKDNKSQLEPKEVDPKMWLAMENQILRKKNRRVSFYLKAAAAMIAMLFGAFFFFQNYQPGQVVNEEKNPCRIRIDKVQFHTTSKLEKRKTFESHHTNR